MSVILQVEPTDLPGVYTIRATGTDARDGESTLRLTATFTISRPTAVPTFPIPTAAPSTGPPLAEIESLLHAFIAETRLPLRSPSLSTRRFIAGRADVPQALDEVATNVHVIAAPPAPFQVLGLDSESLPNRQSLETAVDVYRRSLVGTIATGDYLVNVDWSLAQGGAFRTLAVVSAAGEYRYEPLLDTTLVQTRGQSFAGEEPAVGTILAASDTQPFFSRVSYVELANFLGIPKAWGAVTVSALGSNGCEATFSTSTASGAAIPFAVEEAAAEDTPFGSPRAGCSSPEPGAMECIARSQPFTIIKRLLPWIGPDLETHDQNLLVSLCADRTGSP